MSFPIAGGNWRRKTGWIWLFWENQKISLWFCIVVSGRRPSFQGCQQIPFQYWQVKLQTLSQAEYNDESIEIHEDSLQMLRKAGAIFDCPVVDLSVLHFDPCSLSRGWRALVEAHSPPICTRSAGNIFRQHRARRQAEQRSLWKYSKHKLAERAL